jgi:uncharacterized protein
MPSTKDQISQDMKDAMRARDKERLQAIRLIMAAIKQIEVDERIDVDDERMIVILNKLAKQRRDSISQYQQAERQDLVSQEQFELDIIAHYLPKPLTQDEILSAIDKAILAEGAESMKDMGRVMAVLKPYIQGRADMAQVSSIIKEKLS